MTPTDRGTTAMDQSTDQPPADFTKPQRRAWKEGWRAKWNNHPRRLCRFRQKDLVDAWVAGWMAQATTCTTPAGLRRGSWVVVLDDPGGFCVTPKSLVRFCGYDPENRTHKYSVTVRHPDIHEVVKISQELGHWGYCTLIGPTCARRRVGLTYSRPECNGEDQGRDEHASE